MSPTKTFASSAWADVEALRQSLVDSGARSVEEAAQAFATRLATSFGTVVLARVFIVAPFAALPSEERLVATTAAGGDSRLADRTPVLALLGTAGRHTMWNDRRKSAGHRAIPLLGSDQVRNAPMIAKLLADLEVNLAGLDDGQPIATRRLLGGLNNIFYVDDAQDGLDPKGRQIIPSTDFVRENGVRTVFGMGGAYLDGTLVVTVVFTSESIERPSVDRFPTLIGSFKMATASLLAAGTIFEEPRSSTPT